MASISERESREIEAANASGTTPVVLIHGLWLLPSSWANWADFFNQAGYAPLTPDWPDDPETVEQALPSTRACFAASCRCPSPRSGRVDLSW